MDDRELVNACLRGGAEEFRLVVERYTAPLIAMAMTVMSNRQDAEDACQETFVQVYRHLAGYDPARSFRTWITTILYRRCLSMLRKRSRMRGFVGRMREEGPADPVVAAPEADARTLPPEFYRVLSPRERAALSLWADRDFDAAEIAAVLGCSESTVRVNLFNARRKIRRLLEKRK